MAVEKISERKPEATVAGLPDRRTSAILMTLRARIGLINLSGVGRIETD